MRESIKTGFSFGLTSGTITTLGLMVGLHSGTHSKMVVIGGILTIAIADAFSDALGIHISEEAQNTNTSRHIWESTIATFVSKFVFTLTFVVPILLFELSTAILIGLCWGLSLLSLFSYHIARSQNQKPWRVIMEHLVIAIVVIVTTHFIGDWIGKVLS